MPADIKDIQKIYSDMDKNSSLIKESLLREDLEISRIDTLFRERNNLFEDLKYHYTNDSIVAEDLGYIKKVIDENRELQKLLKEKKRAMSLEFSKKEKTAKKISQYKSIK